MIRLTTAGESHGPALIAMVEGIPAGMPLSEADIQPDLIRRQTGNHKGEPYKGASARMKIEHDRAQIIGGVMGGKTTGGPVALWIENTDHAKWKGKAVAAMTIPRPGHADLAAALKFGYDDLRPGLERASARETAARVAGGAVCRRLLAELGIFVGSSVLRIGTVEAAKLIENPAERIAQAEESPLRCVDGDAAARMQSAIEAAIKAGETLGGVFEVIALGVPPGLGANSQWHTRLSSRIGAAMLGIQAVKGVEIGDGFALAALPGTQAQDAILGESGVLTRASNHAGGIEAGISNGQPLVIRAAMKPIATTIAHQRSVDLVTGRPAETKYERSDYCCVPRAAIVGEAMLCLVLAEAVMEKYGGDSLEEIRPRWAARMKAELSGFHLSGEPQVFWP